MTHLHLLLHIVILDIEALVVPWHHFIYSLLVPDGRLAIQPVHDSLLQVLIICMSFTSKVLLHLQEEVKVRWCEVRTVWRMVECVPKLNNCAGCMRKRSLLSKCPTYLLCCQFMTRRETAFLWIHQPNEVCHEVWAGTGVNIGLHWIEDLKGLAISSAGSTKYEARWRLRIPPSASRQTLDRLAVAYGTHPWAVTRTVLQ